MRNRVSYLINECEYHQAVEDNQGFCTSCRCFTRDCTEPDATKYACPECEKHTVYGAEYCLVSGIIDVETGHEKE